MVTEKEMQELKRLAGNVESRRVLASIACAAALCFVISSLRLSQLGVVVVSVVAVLVAAVAFFAFRRSCIAFCHAIHRLSTGSTTSFDDFVRSDQRSDYEIVWKGLMMVDIHESLRLAEVDMTRPAADSSFDGSLQKVYDSFFNPDDQHTAVGGLPAYREVVPENVIKAHIARGETWSYELFYDLNGNLVER